MRWQSPKERWGFYDIAEGVVLKTAEKGIVKPDWPKFLKVNRKEVWQKKFNKEVMTNFQRSIHVQQKYTNYSAPNEV